MATILICSCTNDELKEELIKLNEPTRVQVNEAIDKEEE